MENAKRLRQAMERRRAAEQAERYEFEQVFPVGSTVTWKKGNHVHTGTVLVHRRYGDSTVRARNTKTGKEVSVTLYDVMQSLVGKDQ